MGKTMKAAVVRALGQRLEIEQRPVVDPGPGQVLVRVQASGVCHTDLHAARGDWPVKPKLPFVPGHEVAGHVAKLGPQVAGLKEGDPVGIPWLHSACGQCADCVRGWETLCLHQQNTGYSVDGGFAQYALAPAAYVARIPAALAMREAAPLLCAGVTTYKALKQTEVRPGQWVAITGVGGLGHLAVQYARHMGLHVVALDIAKDKLVLARELGAEVTVDAGAEDALEQVHKHTGGGVHGAVVTAVAEGAFSQAVGLLRRGGTCVLVGVPPGAFSVSILNMVLGGLTVRGSVVGTRFDMQEALAMAVAGPIRPSIDVQPLDKINEVLERLGTGRVTGRIVLDVA